MACDNVFEYPGLGLLTNELLTVGPGMFGMMHIRVVMRLSQTQNLSKNAPDFLWKFIKTLLRLYLTVKRWQNAQTSPCLHQSATFFSPKIIWTHLESPWEDYLQHNFSLSDEVWDQESNIIFCGHTINLNLDGKKLIFAAGQPMPSYGC